MKEILLGLLLSQVAFIVTEKGMIFGFLSKYDKWLISKPLYSCYVCSSFWYTLLMCCIYDFVWYYPFISIFVSNIYAQISKKII